MYEVNIMLTTCDECGGMLSDQASFCPHCGYSPGQKYKPAQRRRHMRLPNGFGQISEIKGKKLRKPFRAMVTVGKDENGRPICKTLQPEGYFRTYNEAYQALVKYNQNPYDLQETMTMQELYDLWLEKYQSEYSQSALYLFGAAWKRSESVHEMKVREIRPRHIRYCISLAGSSHTQAKTKTLFTHLLGLALDYELVERNWAKDISGIEEDGVKNPHRVFSEDEIEVLWENISNPTAQMVLVQCYTGMRPQELCNVKLSDVDLEANIITGGSKTEAGMNRRIPIHPLIQGIVMELCEKNREYLFERSGKHIIYGTYDNYFHALMTDLGLDENHRPHDCRKHLVTLAKKYKLDEYAIKRIVGHKISDITEAVYTKRGDDWLHEEMAKIKRT